MDVKNEDRIRHFIEAFGVVKKDQLSGYFRNIGEANLSVLLDMLSRRFQIFPTGDDLYSCIAHPTKAMLSYRPNFMALDVLSYMGADAILDYATEVYPINLSFVTTKNVLYDVTAITRENMDNVLATVLRSRQRLLPPGLPDPANHLAVVESVDMIARIGSYVPFSSYIVFDESGVPQFYEYATE